jgi:pilus assembly protein CpaC
MKSPTVQTVMSHNSGILMKMSSCAAALLASFMMLAPLAVSPAKATDINVTQNGEQGRYVRIGLDKSIIIHLPDNARDVVVGNPEIVDAMVRTQNTAYLFARKQGQTNVFFFNAEGQQIMALDLEVALDTMPLTKLLQRSMPGTRITVDTMGKNVILGGTAMDPAEAKQAEDLASQFIDASTWFSGGGKIVNTIKIAGENQVMLQVKVVEIQRDVLKQFGVNFRALIDAGKFAFNLSNINPFASADLSLNQGYKGSFASGNSNFDGVVKAMESDGLLRTLAEPNLTALSGQAASFKAGGEYPYETCDYSTKPVRCEIKFKEFGVELEFTPVVLSEGRINLKIHTAVSELTSIKSGTVSNVPSLNKRSADTVLEMPNGGSMMLAGLIRESTRQNASGTPGLKKIPVLGALFRSRDFQANETELVVMVTPHIVRSVAQQQLTTPDQNFEPSTERQALFFGQLNKKYSGSASKTPQGKYNGNVGFIVE